jgi:hypothetical protein
LKARLTDAIAVSYWSIQAARISNMGLLRAFRQVSSHRSLAGP